MLRITTTGLMLAILAGTANAQNQNLFPGDSIPNVGQAATKTANNLYGGAKQAAQQTMRQVNQTAQQTLGAANDTAADTASSWTRFLQPPQQRNTAGTLIDRWNNGTKNFLEKTKQALSPPPIDRPLLPLPTLDGNRGLLRNVKLPTLPTVKPVSGAKKRSLLPSIFSRAPEAPKKPQTIQDFLGLDRPE